jgi:hypothetical protein
MMGAREISTLHEIKRHGNQRHHQGIHSEDQELVQKPLSSSVRENKLLYSSASDIMVVKHNTKSQHKERCEGGSPGAASGGGCVHKVLEAAQYLALVGGLVKVDGYVCQEEAQDKGVKAQAQGWLK